jgi:hypothetical protein
MGPPERDIAAPLLGVEAEDVQIVRRADIERQRRGHRAAAREPVGAKHELFPACRPRIPVEPLLVLGYIDDRLRDRVGGDVRREHRGAAAAQKIDLAVARARPGDERLQLAAARVQGVQHQYVPRVYIRERQRQDVQVSGVQLRGVA